MRSSRIEADDIQNWREIQELYVIDEIYVEYVSHLWYCYFQYCHFQYCHLQYSFWQHFLSLMSSTQLWSSISELTFFTITYFSHEAHIRHSLSIEIILSHHAKWFKRKVTFDVESCAHRKDSFYLRLVSIFTLKFWELYDRLKFFHLYFYFWDNFILDFRTFIDCLWKQIHDWSNIQRSLTPATLSRHMCVFINSS